MKRVALFLFTALCSAAALAQAAPSACEARAAERKLHGAAKKSFVQKCERDATAAPIDPKVICEAQSAERKLHGAAKNSFVTKCIKDAQG